MLASVTNGSNTWRLLRSLLLLVFSLIYNADQSRHAPTYLNTQYTHLPVLSLSHRVSTRRNTSRSFHWAIRSSTTIPNRAKRMAKLNSSPIVLAEYQGQALPPCCSTRKREQTAPSRSRSPRGSMLHSLVRTFVSWLVLSIFLNLKDETTKMRNAAPKGTFLALKKVSVAFC